MILHNPVIDAILDRRSIRSYSEKQITPDELETVLEAGKCAPSGMNMQSARAVAVQSSEEMGQLVRLAQKVSDSSRNPFYDAPTVILVFSKTSNLTPTEDGCLAIENMFLAAQSLGLGTCWIYAVKDMFGSADGKAWMESHGISSEYTIVGSVAIGYPDCAKPEAKKHSSFFTII